MTAGVTFIGDRVSAAGFRLGGAEVIIPEPGGEGAALEQALAGTGLVLITAEQAARVPPDLLQRARMGLRPLFLVVPDVRGRVAPEDAAARLRRQLGMAE